METGGANAAVTIGGLVAPDAKVIAYVRDIPWVIDSIERLIQRNVFIPSSIFN